MAGIRRSFVVLALGVALALIAGLAWNLLKTQEDGRQSLRDTLERRAALTGKLIGSAFMASNTPEAARARYGGSAASVRAAVETQAAAAQGDQRLMVLGADGRILAARPKDLLDDQRLVERSRHLRAALSGTPALSDVFRDDKGAPIVELAIPFDTPHGRRVLAGSGSAEVVENFAAGVFPTASTLPDAEAFLLDGNGETLSVSGTKRRTPDPALSRALAQASTGEYGARTFVSARIPSSRWRVVLSVPTDRLYAAVDGGPSAAAWRLFAAFTAAIVALVALGFAAAAGTRRLAAATERERAASELAHARLHDPLTGLPNRSLFQDRAEQAIASARRRGRSVAVLFMDVDHFKRVNDSLGHECGDAVLHEIAARLQRSIRAEDTVSRFGGDEFVVLCEDVETQALRVVGAIQAALDEPVVVNGRPVPVSLSIGVAVHSGRDDPRTASELVRDADHAMYRAKDLGRGRVEVFDGELHEQAIARLDAEVALRQAIASEDFVVHYQPIVTLPGEKIQGVEALVRWRRGETGELVPPMEFIPLAEETGLITQIGDWVLRTAVREVGFWARRGLVADDFSLYVNISARQLADPDLPGAVSAALAGWDRPPSTLCLEITETAVTLDPVVAARTLENLSALGVKLALDDFGVGYSSLGQLARSLPISILKLDRSFVAGMTRQRDRGIVEAAASLARALELASVAEGVESAEQAAELAAMGFPLAQGFHFGRPVEAATIVQRLTGSAFAEPL